MSPESLLSLRSCDLVAGSTTIARIEAFDLRPGDFCVVQGESGSGKTSFLRALTAADPVAEFSGGEFRLVGQDLRNLSVRDSAKLRRDTIGFLPQIASSSFEPMRRLDRQFGLRSGDSDSLLEWFGRLDGEGGEQVRALLARRPFAVSGGQAQRIAMASVLARGRKIQLLDEPTVGLDHDRWSRLRDVLLDLCSDRASGATILATHDHELVEQLSASGSVSVKHFADGVLCDGPPRTIEAPLAPRNEIESDWCLKTTGVQVQPGHRAVLTPPLDLALHPSRITALLGRSGLGKTSFARALAGHLETARGEIQFDGVVAAGPSSVHVVPQDALASMPVQRTVGSILAEVVEHGPDGRVGDLDVARAFLRDLELPEEAWDQPADALSGGELRRVAILRGVLSGAKILVVDEPTAGLDARRVGLCIAFLQRMTETRRLAMLWITHDRALAERSAHDLVEWGDA